MRPSRAPLPAIERALLSRALTERGEGKSRWCHRWSACCCCRYGTAAAACHRRDQSRLCRPGDGTQRAHRALGEAWPADAACTSTVSGPSGPVLLPGGAAASAALAPVASVDVGGAGRSALWLKRADSGRPASAAGRGDAKCGGWLAELARPLVAGATARAAAAVEAGPLRWAPCSFCWLASLHTLIKLRASLLASAYNTPITVSIARFPLCPAATASRRPTVEKHRNG